MWAPIEVSAVAAQLQKSCGVEHPHPVLTSRCRRMRCSDVRWLAVASLRMRRGVVQTARGEVHWEPSSLRGRWDAAGCLESEGRCCAAVAAAGFPHAEPGSCVNCGTPPLQSRPAPARPQPRRESPPTADAFPRSSRTRTPRSRTPAAPVRPTGAAADLDATSRVHAAPAAAAARAPPRLLHRARRRSRRRLAPHHRDRAGTTRHHHPPPPPPAPPAAGSPPPARARRGTDPLGDWQPVRCPAATWPRRERRDVVVCDRAPRQNIGSSAGDGRMSPSLLPMFVGAPKSSTGTPTAFW